VLRAISLSKKFGEVVALRNVSIEIGTGEILGIIGPNGSGKTTLINIISGFVKPDSGRILYRVSGSELDITRLPPHRRVSLGISRTFQGSRVYRDLSVIDNLKFSLAYSGSCGKDFSSCMDHMSWVLESTGLDKKLYVRAEELDGFHLKILELCMALARRPKVLMIDELFSGLSHDEISRARDILLEYRSRHRISIIWIEHVVKALAEVADRLVAMNFGEVIASGLPEEVLSSQMVISTYLGR